MKQILEKSALWVSAKWFISVFCLLSKIRIEFDQGMKKKLLYRKNIFCTNSLKLAKVTGFFFVIVPVDVVFLWTLPYKGLWLTPLKNEMESANRNFFVACQLLRSQFGWGADSDRILGIPKTSGFSWRSYCSLVDMKQQANRSSDIGNLVLFEWTILCHCILD